MLQRDVLKQFQRIFHPAKDSVTEWAPNGKNSVRVTLRDGSKFAFTYVSDDEWRLETVRSFIRSMAK